MHLKALYVKLVKISFGELGESRQSHKFGPTVLLKWFLGT